MKKNLTPIFRLWLEKRGKHLIGQGGVELLSAIDKQGSITRAASELGMSYKYAWSHLKEVEKALGRRVVSTRRGGAQGGGAELTDAGKALLKEYSKVKNYLNAILEDKEYREAVSLKISARNQLKGKVKSVEKGLITTSLKIEITEPTLITSVITKEAAEDLKIKVGDDVKAIIKSTEVMVAKE